MGEQKFTLAEAWGFGWTALRANMGFLVGVTIIVILAQVIPGGIADVLKKNYAALALIFQFGAFFLNCLLGAGLVRIVLNLHDQENTDIGDLVNVPLSRVGHFFLSAFLGGLAVLGGLLFLIIPGIIMIVRLQFATYLVIDQGLGAMEALKQSFVLTKGQTWNLFIFKVAMWLINLAGLLCLFVGIFVTLPATTLATAFVYRRLLAAQTVQHENTEGRDVGF